VNLKNKLAGTFDLAEHYEVSHEVDDNADAHRYLAQVGMAGVKLTGRKRCNINEQLPV